MVQNMINTVIEGDCLDVMKSMPDKCVDLAIVDPPYGLKSTNFVTVRMKKRKDKKWNNSIPKKEYFDELRRISKNQIIWGCNYFYPYIFEKGRIVFNKLMTSKNGPLKLSDCDLASCSIGNRIMYFEYQWSGNVQNGKINWANKEGDGIEKRIHPTQKPIALYRWILKEYGKSGDLIFDSHVGSGSSIIACLEEGFDFIGCEIDEEYYNSMQERVSAWKEQGRLFPAHVI